MYTLFEQNKKANISKMLALCFIHIQLCMTLNGIDQDYLNFAETKSEKPRQTFHPCLQHPTALAM